MSKTISSELLDFADKLDKMGLEKEADHVDLIISKIAKKGEHKCGLKESTVLDHEELLKNYEKAMSNLENQYRKISKSNNEIDSPNEGAFRDIANDYAHNCNAVRFHNMYFEDVIYSKPFSIEKDSKIKDLLKELYDGGPSKFLTELKRLSKVSRNGWIVLNFCTITKQLYLDVIDLHDQHVIACSLPVMALDMWEHAYYSDFGLDKEAYVDWFLSRLDWRNIRKRIINYQRIK